VEEPPLLSVGLGRKSGWWGARPPFPAGLSTRAQAEGDGGLAALACRLWEQEGSLSLPPSDSTPEKRAK